MIKKLGPHFRKIICHLFNLSIKTGLNSKTLESGNCQDDPQKK
jgi:hypothetical protein